MPNTKSILRAKKAGNLARSLLRLYFYRKKKIVSICYVYCCNKILCSMDILNTY